MKLKALTAMIRRRNGSAFSRTLFGEATGAEVRCLGTDDNGAAVHVDYNVTVATDGSVWLEVAVGDQRFATSTVFSEQVFAMTGPTRR